MISSNFLIEVLTSSTFWTAVSAIATFVMAYITYKTLRQNKIQLERLEEQRIEDKRARFSSEIIKRERMYLLKVENVGKETAYDVSIKLSGNPISYHVIDRYKKELQELADKKLILPAGKSLYFVLAPAYGQSYGFYTSEDYVHAEEVKKWFDKYGHEPIQVTIYFNNKYVSEEILYFSNMYSVNNVIVQDNLDVITQILKDTQKSLKNKKII